MQNNVSGIVARRPPEPSESDRTAGAEDLISELKDLISLPDIYLKIRALVNDPDSTLTDVANVIAHDPGLSVRILRLVNSAFFGFPSRVETVSRAVSILGMGPVHDIALATSATHAFRGIDVRLMDVEAFWRRSVSHGVLAHLLSVKKGDIEPERLFVAGLLCDIGHLAMYQKTPELAEQALLQCADSGRERFQIERELMGFDFVDVGYALMKEWGLPDYLAQVVRRHLAPSTEAPFAGESALLHIASRLLDGRDSAISASLNRILPEAWEITGLDPDDMAGIYAEADDRIAAIANLLIP